MKIRFFALLISTLLLLGANQLFSQSCVYPGDTRGVWADCIGGGKADCGIEGWCQCDWCDTPGCFSGLNCFCTDSADFCSFTSCLGDDRCT